MSNKLKIIKTILGKESNEGPASVCRIIGGGSLNYFDPYLLVDEALIHDTKRGFPEHPHKGFETLSYLLAGQSRHKDSLGRSGTLAAGDAQWMTAGKGIRHEENPFGDEPMHAFQIWINLKAKDKKIDPYYQDIKSSQMPKKQINDHVHLTVIAGKSIAHDLHSPVILRTNLLVSHVKINKSNEKFVETIPKGFQGIVYFFEGSGKVENHPVPQKAAILFDETTEDTQLEFESTSDKVQVLILSGEPLKEPMVAQGPFVMNTKEEIKQAYQEYYNGEF